MLCALNCINYILELSNNIFSEQPDSNNNIVFSSYSAYIFISLFKNGAVGHTKGKCTNISVGQESEAFVEQTPNDFHRENLKKFEEDNIPNISALKINNFLFYKDEIKIYEEFKNISKNDYGVILNKNNFFLGYEKEINNFVKKNTSGKIKNVLSEGNPNIEVLYINTVVFSGKWKIPFDTSCTFKKSFEISKDESIDVDTMSVLNEFYYYEDEEFEVIKMYYEGEKYYMLFMLPKEEYCIKKLFKKISEKNKLKEICSNLKLTLLSVFLPKFKFEASLNLNNYVIVTNKSPIGIYPEHDLIKTFENHINNISVLQKTFICVDEVQTTVISTTNLKITSDSNPKAFLATFLHFKRNFAFFLMHNDENKSVLPLVCGIIRNPKLHQ